VAINALAKANAAAKKILNAKTAYAVITVNVTKIVNVLIIAHVAAKKILSVKSVHAVIAVNAARIANATTIVSAAKKILAVKMVQIAQTVHNSIRLL